MRVNKLIAERLGISRRKADKIIEAGQVTMNGQPVTIGQQITDTATIYIDGQLLPNRQPIITILFNKPVGYVCSKDGQGSNTIYDILPAKYLTLNPVGRLDKDSSGLLLLTNDGNLHQELTHPKYQKEKIYHVILNKALAAEDCKRIEQGIELEDGISKLSLKSSSLNDKAWTVTMHEGRNRQIRRTFEKAGYKVMKLHRTNFGNYALDELLSGEYVVI
jgi:23S rRNA pseudouridine2605 synthase